MPLRRRNIFFSLCTIALLMAVLFSVSASGQGAPCPKAQGQSPLRVPYMFSVDEVTGNELSFSDSRIRVLSDCAFPKEGNMTVKGWVATDEGIQRYEYAWVSDYHSTPHWQTASGEIIPRGDLAGSGIPYPGGHGTAGFSVEICPPEGMADGYYDLYFRAVSGDGADCDLFLFNRIIYGSPDRDDGNSRSISFARLCKTPGALQNATADDTGLTLTNRSMVSLGKIDLSSFERIRIACSLSETYTPERASLVGFKSAPDHLYGDGASLYNLTDHVTALPLDTNHSRRQIPELDLTQTEIPATGELYLSVYLPEGVSLRITGIEFVYRGMGFNRTNAKLMFSSDVTGYFNGLNRVELKGVTDPVMGDVLRIELTEDTNDPYAFFNARQLLVNYDLRMTADDYKYMVVLARANPKNAHNTLSLYLCAGTILGATEACTYHHQLINDGQWHYYVFDLSDRENWTGVINGWRFDIISGSSQAGNYVDFASVQLFRTRDEATAAAAASVTENVTPHLMGSPAVIPVKESGTLAPDGPMSFEEGDWYVETPAETPTEPPAETSAEGKEPLSSAEAATSEQTSPVETSHAETSPAETSPAESTGCRSAGISLIPLLLFPFVLVIKKKTEEF